MTRMRAVLGGLVCLVGTLMACGEPTTSVSSVVEETLSIPQAMLGVLNDERAVHVTKTNSAQDSKDPKVLKYEQGYPTNPDGSPNTSDMATVRGYVHVGLTPMGTHTYWDIVVSTYYRGSNAAHIAKYTISKGATQLFSSTLENSDGGFWGSFQLYEKYFSSDASGFVEGVCGHNMTASSAHWAEWNAPNFLVFPATHWGHVNDNPTDQASDAACPPPAPSGGSSQPKVGPDGQWYACYVIDYFDLYTRQYLYTDVIACTPIEMY
ncbi:MAG: hypothetical protein JWO05_1890 [Gemmatimonadetes bacterium]|nr:hypothetical protein [Gemmatimonadota bacterium]